MHRTTKILHRTLKLYTTPVTPLIQFSPWTMKEIYEAPTIRDKLNRKSDLWIEGEIEGRKGFKYLPFGGDVYDVYPDDTNVIYEGRELLILADVPLGGLKKVHDTRVDFIDRDFLCLSIDINPNGEITHMICPLLEYESKKGMGLIFLAIELLEARDKVRLVYELFEKLRLPTPKSPLRTRLASEKRRVIEIDNNPKAKLFDRLG